MSSNEYHRQDMARRRAAARDVQIPPVVNQKRRESCIADPLLFLSTYFPTVYFNDWTDGQREMVAAVVESARHGVSQAIAAPRGDGKTKIVEGCIIYAVVSGVIRFPVIVASDAKASQRILANCKWLLSADCHLLAEDFPEVCVPIIALKGDARLAARQTVNGEPTEIGFSKEFLRLPKVAGSVSSGAIIYPLSIEGGMRGLAMGSERPDFVLIDDPETRESASSSYQVSIREEIIDRDIAGLKGQRGALGMVALVTIQTPHSLAARLTDRAIKPAWNGIRRAMIETWPDRTDLWDEYQQRRRAAQESGDRFAKDATDFYVERREEMDAGSVVTNPHRYMREPGPDGRPLEVSALQSCYNFIADKGIDAFKCEYQNDPSIDELAEAMKLTAKGIECRYSQLQQREAPSECIGVTIGIDVGKYACHWTQIAWRSQGEGFIVDYGVAEVYGTDPQADRTQIERAVRTALSNWHDEIATMPIVSASGQSLTTDMVLVDSGDGVLTDAIYEWVKGLPAIPKVCAAKGYGEGQAPKPRSFGADARKAPRIDGHHWFAQLQPHAGVWLYNLDANFWKLWVHERFACALDPDGNATPYSLSLFLPGKTRQHHSYARHVVAEEFREEFTPGRGVKAGWHKVSANNHWLDSTYMACAAAAMQQWFPITDRATPVIVEQPQPVPSASRSQLQRRGHVAPSRRAGGWNGRTFIARR